MTNTTEKSPVEGLTPPEQTCIQKSGLFLYAENVPELSHNVSTSLIGHHSVYLIIVPRIALCQMIVIKVWVLIGYLFKSAKHCKIPHPLPTER